MTRAVVVGGGIGGLSAGIALRGAGVDTVICERAPDLAKVEVGAGMTLWPNAMRVLDRLGVAGEVYARGAVLDRFEQRTNRGRLLAVWPLDRMADELGERTVGVGRTDVHAALAQAAGDMVRTGAELTGWEEDDSGVTAQLADGSSERGDVLIGADGIRSMVRSRLLGDGTPRFAGLSTWRAIAELDSDAVPPVPFSGYWGPGIRFVYFWTGPGKVSWEAIQAADEEGGQDPPDGRKQVVRDRFAGWDAPAEPIIDATDERAISRTDIHDWPPVQRWGSDRVTLLGDAAHAMTFAVGQGAAQAMEDALALADALGANGDAPAALRAYERRRIDRAAHFQKLAWRMARIGRYRNPVSVGLRNLVVQATSRPGFRMSTKDMAADKV